MNEQRQKDISKEYIKEKVLNKDLLEIQESLGNLKKNLDMWDNSDQNIFWVDNIMNILFNKEWKKRSKMWFEANKLKSFMYYIISEEWKQNLDLLYNELEKSKSEDELKNNLWLELFNLETEVTNNNQIQSDQGDNIQKETESEEIQQSENDQTNIENESTHIIQDDEWKTNTENEKINIESLNEKENYIYNQAKLYWITDNREIAYVLATVKWECGFNNIKEIWWEKRNYGKEWYYGRWYVQLTHKWNYNKFTKIIQKSELNFKDNNWNIIKWKDVDLVKNPDLILKSNDLAAFILVYWMKNWSFTGKKLKDYINWDKCDFKNSRRIINWTSKADFFARYANEYLAKLWDNKNETEKWDKKIDTKKIEKILVWPELLAKDNKQLWWLWNSMMTWFQWYKNKTKFPNMNWIEWKSTKTHPDRFKSQQDVKDYIKKHPWVKSFMFYFGANTTNNNQTLSDIEQRSEWFEQEWVQPVLCTCIGENNHPHLTELNKKILQLWKEKNWPVLDFASSYNNGEIAMWNNKHPTSAGYNKMSDEINQCLV